MSLNKVNKLLPLYPISDPVYAFVVDNLKRMENVLGVLPDWFYDDVAYLLKKLARHNDGKYKFSTSTVVAVLYWYGIVDYIDALMLLRIYGGSKKRLKESIRAIRKVTGRKFAF